MVGRSKANIAKSLEARVPLQQVLAKCRTLLVLSVGVRRNLCAMDAPLQWTPTRLDAMLVRFDGVLASLKKALVCLQGAFAQHWKVRGTLQEVLMRQQIVLASFRNVPAHL